LTPEHSQSINLSVYLYTSIPIDAMMMWRCLGHGKQKSEATPLELVPVVCACRWQFQRSRCECRVPSIAASIDIFTFYHCSTVKYYFSGNSKYQSNYIENKILELGIIPQSIYHW
jgi:hypothetical protein